MTGTCCIRAAADPPNMKTSAANKPATTDQRKRTASSNIPMAPTSRWKSSILSNQYIVGLFTSSIRPNAKGEKIIDRSEEHTSELQSHLNIVCRLLLEK